MEKLDMHTPNLADKNYEILSKMFPNAVTESIDENGEVVRAIDADVLRQEISCKVVEGRDERYQFTWPDKKKSVMLANQPIAKTLRLNREKSVGRDGTTGNIDSENIYIEGDNLDALKLLQETYLGKVKMIYIDPPYNRGSDAFIYDDDFAKSSGEFAENSGAVDVDGNRLFDMRVNNESNGRFHTDWLNMMYPRLRLAKDLLSDDGVIFISIDDNEQENLKKICDEIFGSENFVADLIWQKKFSRANDATYFSTMHDHIICFCKMSKKDNSNGWEIGLLPRGDEIPQGYSNPDSDDRGVWTSVSLSAKSGSQSLLYEIVAPNGRKHYPPNGRYWSCSESTFNEWLKDNRIWFGADGNGVPRKKTFLSEVQRGLRPNTILFHNEFGNNQEGKQESKEMFDGVSVFDGPKPVKLLTNLVRIANTDKDSIILDFFSGSATTAQAVMQLNAEDGGRRKFTMVQLPEVTDDNSEAKKAGYNTICDIGEERIRRAGKKIKEETGKDIDYGFRVFTVDSSNMKDVYYGPKDLKQDNIDLFADNIKEDRTPEDLLFQVMLELGVLLSSKIEETEIGGKKVFNVADGFLIACFDKDVTEETIKAVAKMKPYYAVFRDSCMVNDSVATNFDQIFANISPDTIRKVL